jgi:CheY-like chemotaxis protein
VIDMGVPTRHPYTRPEALRVLLVEDNKPLAEATAEFLRSEGLEVRLAATGGAALTSLVAFRPDIVLCDLRLPDMDGFDLARAVRKSPATRNAVLVIHTAFSETDIADGSNEVDLFLSKPITAEKLDRVLELSRRPPIEI